LGLGGIFGGVEFEDIGEEKTGGGFDNAVGFSSPYTIADGLKSSKIMV